MTCKRFKSGVLCDFATEPSDTECREAINSQGGACRKCTVDCRRRGWSKEEFTADNARLVAETRLRNAKAVQETRKRAQREGWGEDEWRREARRQIEAADEGA